MLSINIYFFIICIKFFLFFILFKIECLKKIKKELLYYFLYDLHLSIAVLFIHGVKSESYLGKLLIATGAIFFLFQCYQTFCLVNAIVGKSHIPDRFEKTILSFGFLVGLFRFIYALNQVSHSSLQTYINIVDVFRDTKLLFFAIFFVFVIFQLYFVFPSMVRLFYFVYCYPIKNSLVKRALRLLSFIFIIKVGLDYFHLNILQFFRSVHANNVAVAIIVQTQSDQFLHVISIFAFVVYGAVFYFIFHARKILFRTDSFFAHLPHRKIALSIKNEWPIDMSLEGKSFQDFIFSVALENIQEELDIDASQVSLVFFAHSKNNEYYCSLADPNSLFHKAIVSDGLLSYDYCYDYMYLSTLGNDIGAHDLIKKKEIAGLLEKMNQRIVFPIFLRREIIGFLGISFDTLHSKSFFFDEELVYLYEVARYIEMILDRVHKDPFYRKLQYQNKIAESNLQEHNRFLKKMYHELSQKINHISQVVLLEDRKEKIILYGLHEKYKQDMSLQVILKNIHKNIPLGDIKKVGEQGFITDADANDLCIFSTGKVKLGRYFATIHTFLPFIKKKNNFFSFGLLDQKIDDIFSEQLDVCENERKFFFELQLNYTIKIIINSDYIYDSFFAIASYLSDFECVLFSFKKFFNDEKKILDYFTYLIHSRKRYSIFFIDMDKNFYDLQYTILDMYFDYVVCSEVILVKLFFFISDENAIKHIHYKIIQSASLYSYKPSSFSNIKIENMLYFLKQYAVCILNKYYPEDSIFRFAQDNYVFLKEHNSFYSFLDFFEKVIGAYAPKSIVTTYSKDFYLKEAALLGKAAFKNNLLMNELLKICDNNYSQIAVLLDVHKSTVSRYFKKKQKDYASKK
jgi:hypothetical protein